jgi:hypothetical protein
MPRVRMWPRVDDAVAIRRPAADVPAVITNLETHRRFGTEPGAQDLTLGLMPKQHDQRAVGRISGVDRPVQLR